MRAAETASKTKPNSPDVRAAAVLYLVLVVTSIFGFFAPQALTVPHDAGATAHNILRSETLFRLSIASGLIATITFVFLGRELYRLLRSVNRSRATLMIILVLLSIPIAFVGSLSEIAALRLIDGPAQYGLGAGQINGLAMFFLGLSSDTSALNSIFFGLWLLPFGLLVIKSGFMPRFLGYLLIIAGCSYLVGTLNFVLAPPFASVISSIATVGYLGELAVVAWLVVKAVQQQLGGASSRITTETTSDSTIEGGNSW